MRITTANPYFSLLKIAWKYARDERRRYLQVYGFFVAANLVSALDPILWGWFIHQLQVRGVSVLRVTWLYLGGYFLIKLAIWMFNGPARIMERKLAFNLSRNFLQEVYCKVLHLPVKWHQDHHSGSKINRVRMAYNSLRAFFENGYMYLNALAGFVISFGAILFFAPLFGSIAILLGALTVFIIFRFDKPYIATLKQINEKDHVVASTLVDSLSNINTVITLRLEKRMEEGLLDRVGAVFTPFRRNIVINEWKWFSVDLSIGLIYAVILGGYMYQNYVPGEVFLIGGLVTLMGYVGRFTGVFSNIAWQYTQVLSYHTNVQGIDNILESYDKRHRPGVPNVLPAGWQRIDISDLSFRHNNERWPQDRGRYALQSIHIDIRRGRRIALIGESGCGKTTLLTLLRGLYAPDEARIEIDGRSFSRLDVLASHVTLFPQEPEIFENTIEYNITLGLPFAREEIEQAMETANLTGILQQLPEGLQTRIVEKGVNLSGGQRQRLALARGVLAARDSDIVLLDEPTSSVDPKTELEIYEKLFRCFEQKSVISTLHRLHLLRLFDYVYVLQRGRLVDEGTFDELRERSGVFQELWRHQQESAK